MNKNMENLVGRIVTSSSGKKYTLANLAGQGSQGVVYVDESGNYVVKLYYPTNSENIDKSILERLNFIKNIKKPKHFLDILDTIEQQYIGYVMKKVEDGHVPLNTYLIPEKNISFLEWYNRGFGLRERIMIGYIIAKAFGDLERINLSYCDISGNNILVKIKSGQKISIQLIDIDNIYTAGKGTAAVLGTPRYIAPEVISRQRNPDVLSDNYSLAVLLFELLRVGHPYISDDILDGTPEDEEAALAGKYDYVHDENSTNMLPADIVFTKKLKSLFEKCFVNGKKNRIERPSAREFELALLDASNKVIKCHSCGAWHYPRKSGKEYEGCPWCGASSKPKAMLNFYDILFEGEDHKSGKIVSDAKLVTTYILREKARNLIKNFYVFRYDNPATREHLSENFITVATNQDGYGLYNESERSGVIIKQCRSGKYIPVDKYYLLESGDCIYFEINDGHASKINVGGKDYSFIRMARFVEEHQ